MKVTVYNRIDDTEINYELASFGERLAARVIDTLIIIIPSIFIPILPAWLYWSLMQSGDSQATVGQKALNIKVISEGGERVSFGKATGRFFATILNGLTLTIGWFMFFFNDKRQCLHGMVSGTMIVKDRPSIGNHSVTDQLLDDGDFI